MDWQSPTGQTQQGKQNQNQNFYKTPISEKKEISKYAQNKTNTI